MRPAVLPVSPNTIQERDTPMCRPLSQRGNGAVPWRTGVHHIPPWLLDVSRCQVVQVVHCLLPGFIVRQTSNGFAARGIGTRDRASPECNGSSFLYACFASCPCALRSALSVEGSASRDDLPADASVRVIGKAVTPFVCRGTCSSSDSDVARGRERCVISRWKERQPEQIVSRIRRYVLHEGGGAAKCYDKIP